jgi:PAS domain S-box-containing protein
MQSNSQSAVGVIEAERFRHFIVSVTDYAIYMLSPEGIVATWNAGAERFKGYKSEEIIGRHFSAFYTAEDQARGRPQHALDTARNTGRFVDEGWRVRKDGTHFWASVVLDPIRDDAGELLGFTKITRDITEQKAAQEELHASEERFRLLVQGVTDYAIYMLSTEGLVTNWNEGARRIKGYQAEEVVGRSFSMFYTPEDIALAAPQAALAAALREGRFEKEGWRVRKDGTRFWAHVVIDPIHDSNGKPLGFAKVTRDITERRLAAENLERAREVLFQSQKLEAIGKLTGGIAHDFNNLLNVVMNGLDLLRMTSDKAMQAKTLDTMERAAQRGASLTQQLLAFARQQPLQQEVHDLGRIVRAFEAVLRRAIPSGMQLRLQLADAPLQAMIDPTQFEAALLNLVVNARDAMSEHGTAVVEASMVTLGEAEVDQLPAGRYVRVAVSDSGAGMTPETLARVVLHRLFLQLIDRTEAVVGFGKRRAHRVLVSEHRLVALRGDGVGLILHAVALEHGRGDGAGQPPQRRRRVHEIVPVQVLHAAHRRQLERRQQLVARGLQVGVDGDQVEFGARDVGTAAQQFGRQAGRYRRRLQLR